MNCLQILEMIRAAELSRGVYRIEGKSVVGTAHPFPRRLVVMPRHFVSEDYFHCTFSERYQRRNFFEIRAGTLVVPREMRTHR